MELLGNPFVRRPSRIDVIFSDRVHLPKRGQPLMTSAVRVRGVKKYLGFADVQYMKFRERASQDRAVKK